MLTRKMESEINFPEEHFPERVLLKSMTVDTTFKLTLRFICKEQTNDTHKLEFLALKWSITERFHEYLYGRHFEVYTDNNPLTYTLTTAK